MAVSYERGTPVQRTRVPSWWCARRSRLPRRGSRLRPRTASLSLTRGLTPAHPLRCQKSMSLKYEPASEPGAAQKSSSTKEGKPEPDTGSAPCPSSDSSSSFVLLSSLELSDQEGGAQKPSSTKDGKPEPDTGSSPCPPRFGTTPYLCKVVVDTRQSRISVSSRLSRRGSIL